MNCVFILNANLSLWKLKKIHDYYPGELEDLIEVQAYNCAAQYNYTSWFYTAEILKSTVAASFVLLGVCHLFIRLESCLQDASSVILRKATTDRTLEITNSLRPTKTTRAKSDLLKAFNATKPADEALKILAKLEKLFPESELGTEYWIIAEKLQKQGHPSTEVIRYGQKALRILIQNHNNEIKAQPNNNDTDDNNGHNHGPALFVPGVLIVLGTASLDLKRYDESLSYLNWADRNLSKLLELEESDDTLRCGDSCVLHLLHECQEQLVEVKVAMGRKSESVVHLKRISEIEDKILEDGCLDLGHVYKKVARGYVEVGDFGGAYPFCVRALEVYRKHLGDDSEEVGKMHGLLSLVYSACGEYEKALVSVRLWKGNLMRRDPEDYDLVKVETQEGTLLRHLGRFREAVGVFKGVVSRAESGGRDQATGLLFLAKVLCNLGSFVEAKKHLRSAQGILEKDDICPSLAANGFADMANMYEKMNDYEMAVAMTRKYLSSPQVAENLILEGSARLFSLMSLAHEGKEGIPCMKTEVENLKQKFGPDHPIVGYGYVNLGLAYLKSGQVETAAESFLKAKDLLDATLGPRHMNSLNTSQTLSATYARLERYDPAAKIQEKVVKCLKSLRGQRERDFLQVAAMILEKMEERDEDSAFWKTLSLKMATTTLERFESLMEID